MEYPFEYAFKLSSNKNYEKMMEVYAAGNSTDNISLQSTTTGLISKEREYSDALLLQLSMSINEFDIGGPVFDSSGRLHGILVSKLTGTNYEGVCFAFPSHMINDFLKIIETKK